MGLVDRLRRAFGARRAREDQAPGELIAPRARWEDLAIDEKALRTLRELTSEARPAQARERPGVGALFIGPSKAGNALAAEALGTDLAAGLYRVDLGRVVSKYIGETEKNLELVFARAEDKNWILFFDEADALFGKRTDVADAHDRYADQEINYLLQQIEAYNGLAIVATMSRDELILEELRKRFRYVVGLTLG